MPGQQLVMQDIVCTNCNDVLTNDNIVDEDIGVCDSCRDEHVGYCNFCGDDYMVSAHMMHRADEFGVSSQYNHMVYVDDENLCTGCVSECSDCGTMYAYESDAWDCCPEPEQDRMHNYGFRPALKFWDSEFGIPIYKRQARPGVLYMGLEIEVEKCADYVREMTERDAEEDFYNPNFYYWKSDGSLGSQGSELVTMPATLWGHRDRFPFANLDWLHAQGARGWAYPSCGFHIHVSRSAFTGPHMWKFIKFQLHNSAIMSRIAGRDSHQWAAWDNMTMQNARRDAKKYAGMDWQNDRDSYPMRYSALNFLNMNTVELRYFRSNISKHGIMRNIELVHAMWAYTKQLTVRDLIAHGWSFSRFVGFLQQNLSDYGTIAEYINREGIA